MQKNRLFHLFCQLSSWELNHFEAFLRSPYFNKRADVLRLFDFFKQHIKTEISREAAYKFVWPKKDYSDKEAYLLFSYLYKLLEDFLAFQQIRKDKALIKFHSACAYRDLKMESAFTKKLTESKAILTKNGLRNSDYLRRLFDLEKEHYDYLGSAQRSAENNLEEVGRSFDVYYIAEKIRQHCFQLSHQAVFEKEYKTDMMDAVIKFVEENEEMMVYPPIVIYYNFYKALTAENDGQYFQKFRETIDRYKTHFTITEIRDIYLIAINICIRRANKGGRHYVVELFELYKKGIEQDVFVENDVLSSFAFKNILSAGIKLKQLDWLDEFIHNYQSKLSPHLREATVRYTTAALRYEQNKYEEALQFLTGLESDDYLLVLSAKTIQLKILYEQEDFESLDTLLESMRIYLQRKRKMGYHKEVYQNVIRLTKRLMMLAPYDKKRKADLEAEVATMQPQSLRDWFLEMIG